MDVLLVTRVQELTRKTWSSSFRRPSVIWTLRRSSGRGLPLLWGNVSVWSLELLGSRVSHLEMVDVLICSLRPGGATHLLLVTEDPELCRRRGRWLSSRVMEIYLQEVIATTYVQKLHPATKFKVTISLCISQVAEVCIAIFSYGHSSKSLAFTLPGTRRWGAWVIGDGWFLSLVVGPLNWPPTGWTPSVLQWKKWKRDRCLFLSIQLISFWHLKLSHPCTSTEPALDFCLCLGFWVWWLALWIGLQPVGHLVFCSGKSGRGTDAYIDVWTIPGKVCSWCWRRGSMQSTDPWTTTLVTLCQMAFGSFVRQHVSLLHMYILDR